MTEIINNQRKIQIDRKIFQEFAAKLIDQVVEAKDSYLDVVFVSDKKMRQLNKQFRGKDRTTDVLSFPFEADGFEIVSELQESAGKFLGEIVISAEQADRQARENDLDFETETKQLILHGMLHLCGYDHETDAGEMNARELELRDKLQIN